MATKTINISLPKELVSKIDSAAKLEYASRSDYIRQALVGRLQATEVQSREEAWSTLMALSDEVATNAERLGITSDEDIMRAVKEVRRDASGKKR
jgi:metal-responsive CopG/Arc/MetJ family transcriptional regulator